MWLVDVFLFTLNGFTDKFRHFAPDSDGLERPGLTNPNIKVPWPWTWTLKYQYPTEEYNILKQTDSGPEFFLRNVKFFLAQSKGIFPEKATSDEISCAIEKSFFRGTLFDAGSLNPFVILNYRQNSLTDKHWKKYCDNFVDFFTSQEPVASEHWFSNNRDVKRLLSRIPAKYLGQDILTCLFGVNPELLCYIPKKNRSGMVCAYALRQAPDNPVVIRSVPKKYRNEAQMLGDYMNLYGY